VARRTTERERTVEIMPSAGVSWHVTAKCNIALLKVISSFRSGVLVIRATWARAWSGLIE
jgi:hypothetical protein